MSARRWRAANAARALHGAKSLRAPGKMVARASRLSAPDSRAALLGLLVESRVAFALGQPRRLQAAMGRFSRVIMWRRGGAVAGHRGASANGGYRASARLLERRADAISSPQAAACLHGIGASRL